MADLPSVEAYLEGKSPDGIALFRRFEEMVHRCGPSEPAPRRSIVYWKRNRVFAGAFVEGRRLELNVDLVREVQHAGLIAAFNTTKRVITHRIRVTEADQLDDSLEALVVERVRGRRPRLSRQVTSLH